MNEIIFCMSLEQYLGYSYSYDLLLRNCGVSFLCKANLSCSVSYGFDSLHEDFLQHVNVSQNSSEELFDKIIYSMTYYFQIRFAGSTISVNDIIHLGIYQCYVFLFLINLNVKSSVNLVQKIFEM